MKRRKMTLATRLIGAATSPTGLTCAGLALICGSIAANALLLQGGRHPSPLFVTRAAAVEEEPDGHGDLMVQAVQQGLADAGFYSGPIDGIAGAQTRRAILRFERETGRPEIGKATSDLIAAVEAWAAPASASAVPNEVSTGTASGDSTVIAVQNALSRAAYGPLNVDGVFGQQTRDAITRFQLDQGLPLTGTIDDKLIRRLKSLGALEGA